MVPMLTMLCSAPTVPTINDRIELLYDFRSDDQLADFVPRTEHKSQIEISDETGRLWGPTGLLLGAALVVHFRCESQLALTVSASVLVALTCRLLRPDQAPAARCLPLAAALYAVLALLYLATPAALQSLQAAARSWSALLARTLLDHPLDLGPSLLGFWVGLSLRFASLIVVPSRFLHLM